MLIKPFSILFKDQVDPTEMSYIGFVEDNNDPEKLGRIRVRVSPYSELDTQDIPWASPTLGTHGNSAEYGGLNIPELGSQVRVFFPSKDITAPYYGGAELNEVNRTTFFDEDYPYTYGYKDSVGNFVRINKERGTAQFQHYTSTNLQVAPDGSLQVCLSNGAYFIFDNGNNFSLNIGTVDISGSVEGSLDVEAKSEINVKTGQMMIDGSLTVTGDFTPQAGVSGSFLTNGNFVTVKNGIIVAIE
jgi:phage baseplate assembly protein gpV